MLLQAEFSPDPGWKRSSLPGTAPGHWTSPRAPLALSWDTGPWVHTDEAGKEEEQKGPKSGHLDPSPPVLSPGRRHPRRPVEGRQHGWLEEG